MRTVYFARTLPDRKKGGKVIGRFFHGTSCLVFPGRGKGDFSNLASGMIVALRTSHIRDNLFRCEDYEVVAGPIESSQFTIHSCGNCGQDLWVSLGSYTPPIGVMPEKFDRDPEAHRDTCEWARFKIAFGAWKRSEPVGRFPFLKQLSDEEARRIWDEEGDKSKVPELWTAAQKEKFWPEEKKGEEEDGKEE